MSLARMALRMRADVLTAAPLGDRHGRGRPEGCRGGTRGTIRFNPMTHRPLAVGMLSRSERRPHLDALARHEARLVLDDHAVDAGNGRPPRALLGGRRREVLAVHEPRVAR